MTKVSIDFSGIARDLTFITTTLILLFLVLVLPIVIGTIGIVHFFNLPKEAAPFVMISFLIVPLIAIILITNSKVVGEK